MIIEKLLAFYLFRMSWHEKPPFLGLITWTLADSAGADTYLSQINAVNSLAPGGCGNNFKIVSF